MVSRNPFAPADVSRMMAQFGSDMGDTIAQNRERHSRKSALNDLLSGQADPAMVLLGDAQRTGDIEGAHKLAQVFKSQQGDSISPYQQEQIRLAEERNAFARQNSDAYVARQQAASGAPKIGSTVETIKSKLARGEQLTPGEKQVYDDAARGDPIMRALFGNMPSTPGSADPAAMPQSRVAPRPQAPRTSALSTGPRPFTADPKKREVGQVYNLPDGRQALWTQDPSGNVGWELLN